MGVKNLDDIFKITLKMDHQFLNWMNFICNFIWKFPILHYIPKILCDFPLIIALAILAEACSRGGGCGVVCVLYQTPTHVEKGHPGFEHYKTNATPVGVEKGLTI